MSDTSFNDYAYMIATQTENVIREIVIKKCETDYPRECAVIVEFLRRGATSEMIYNALKKNFAGTVKLYYLLNYALYMGKNGHI